MNATSAQMRDALSMQLYVIGKTLTFTCTGHICVRHANEYNKFCLTRACQLAVPLHPAYVLLYSCCIYPRTYSHVRQPAPNSCALLAEKCGANQISCGWCAISLERTKFRKNQIWTENNSISTGHNKPWIKRHTLEECSITEATPWYVIDRQHTHKKKTELFARNVDDKRPTNERKIWKNRKYKQAQLQFTFRLPSTQEFMIELNRVCCIKNVESATTVNAHIV